MLQGIIRIIKKTYFALYGRGEALIWCKILPEGLGRLPRPGNTISELFDFSIFRHHTTPYTTIYDTIRHHFKLRAQFGLHEKAPSHFFDRRLQRNHRSGIHPRIHRIHRIPAIRATRRSSGPQFLTRRGSG